MNDKLKKLRLLKADWDSYGAPPISEKHLQAASDFLQFMSVTPSSTGGVMLEWHCMGYDIEILFDDDGVDIDVEKVA